MSEKSEFAALNDLALMQGIPHSELISEIHDRILVEYKRLYPTKTKTVEVLVNEKTGEVKLMRDREDITPDEFIPVAERVAREVIIEKLSSEKTKVPVTSVEKERVVQSKVPGFGSLGKWVLGTIFWGYNLLYVFVVIIFVANILLNKEYRQDLYQAVSTLGIFRSVFIGIAAFVPLITIFTAAKLMKNKAYDKLSTLFFLFEVPLVVVPLFFANMIANPTPVMWFFMTIFLFAIPLFLLHILGIEAENKETKIVLTFLRETTLISVGYATLLFSFVAPLILGTIVKMISEFFMNDVFRISGSYSHYYINPFEILLTLFFGGLFILILLSLTVAPYILFYLLFKAFLKSKIALSEVLGDLKADKLILVFAALWFVLFVGLSYQPNADKYIDQLEHMGQANTFEEKESIARELLPEEAKIKRAFEDLKDVRNRYLMAKSDDYLKEAYVEVLNFNNLSAELIQQSFMAAAYPFVYQGNLDRSQLALKSFEYMFGRDLYSYTQPTQVKNVELAERKIEAKTDYDGLIATVSITEEYINTTFRDQEVIYEFSLPADSAVVDLKLGPDLEFPGIIAPKGAAARVYQQEVTRQRDPALLEQTGPSQYRLRVFPVPAKNSSVIFGKNQKIQFSYITPVTHNGFGLPVYSKEQNVRLGTVLYFVNGVSAAADGDYMRDKNSDAAGAMCSKKDPVSARTKLASASAYLVPNISLAQSFECDSNGLSLIKDAQNLKIAIVFDVSYSNKDNKLIDEVKEIVKNNSDFLTKNTVDVYKFNDFLSAAQTAKNMSDVFDFVFFGTGDWVKAVSSLNGAYNFAVLITDENEPPLRQTISVKKDFPVYIVHSDVIPAYTTPITGELLQGGGLTFNSVKDALNIAISGIMRKTFDSKELIEPGSYFGYYADSPAAKLILNDWLTVQSGNDPLAKLIARKLVDRKIDDLSSVGVLDTQVQFLDTLNTFAVNNSVVTPYSSLIALVNERQLKNLQQQAQNFDRYKEQSSGGTSINLSPGGQFRSLSNPLFGVDTLNLEVAPSGGGGPFGAVGAPSGVALMDGGGGGFGSGLSLIVLANVLILGGGIAVFIMIRIVKVFKERRSKMKD